MPHKLEDHSPTGQVLLCITVIPFIFLSGLAFLWATLIMFPISKLTHK